MVYYLIPKVNPRERKERIRVSKAWFTDEVTMPILPRGAMGAPFLETFKARMDGDPGSLS